MFFQHFIQPLIPYIHKELQKKSKDILFRRKYFVEVNGVQDNEIFNNNESVVLRNTPFKSGYVYDLRRIGVKDGKKTWIAFEVAPQPINNDVKTTIKQVLNNNYFRKEKWHFCSTHKLFNYVFEICYFMESTYEKK